MQAMFLRELPFLYVNRKFYFNPNFPLEQLILLSFLDEK